MESQYYKQYEPIFGAWHITRLIGEGSLGKVFAVRVEDDGLQSEAALKAVTISQSPEQKQHMTDRLMAAAERPAPHRALSFRRLAAAGVAAAADRGWAWD